MAFRTRRGFGAAAAALALATSLISANGAFAASSAPTGEAAVQRTCDFYWGTTLTVRGHTGPRVLEVQCLLRSRGYQLALDGDFGPDTENRVMLLQACMGLTIDGKVGVNTWRALRSNGCDHDG